jgi:hypothetical protein
MSCLGFKNCFCSLCKNTLLSAKLIFCPQAGRPRRRNAAAPGAISLRSMAPAKAAYAATVIFFSSFPPHEICVKKIEE